MWPMAAPALRPAPIVRSNASLAFPHGIVGPGATIYSCLLRFREIPIMLVAQRFNVHSCSGTIPLHLLTAG